jgi:predicted nucleotidyltransferase
MMADNQLRADLLDNIDDCYIDRVEEEEKNPVTDHWVR